ncbi:hypothetical protein MAPG_00977 [Magnaporthiopsis poae ATCC 64411]|uniref:SYO1-like TPR repeats domain-containing protein n=1 Tax=Magnaporthiopsis poae (strain ATCC 64411 / 73-15) TaxID=644358 RepID=A0A0C4DMH0_MAGP6|nr:hypothetical protein MAPG_00977 [Magnaporthiopsis poae ATCC 64411]
MGKSRRNRERPHRSDPVAKPKGPPADPELAKLREAKILPVLKDLKSADPKLRTTAAGAIANIIQDQKCRKLLLREQVVHTVLTETLTDSSLESRAAGWEVLKVIALEEESDFCVHLYRVDVLTAIEHACNTTTDALTCSSPEFAKLSKAQQGFVWNIAGAVVSLLGNLGEAQDEILQAITANKKINQFLFNLVSHAATPAEVLTGGLTAMLILSEDNRPFCEEILNDQATSCYKKLMKLSESGGLKAALSCGVLHNLITSLEWHDHSRGLDSACDAILIPALSQELASASLEADGAQWDVLQVAIEVLASIATSLQTTLEKGNKVEAEWNGFDDSEDHEMEGVVEEDDRMDEDGVEKEEDGDGEGGDDQDEGDEVEMDEDELLADMAKVTGVDHEPEGPATLEDLPTLSALVDKAVPSLIRLASSSPKCEEASAIRAVALSALNNLAWTISCVEFANNENEAIFRLWLPVGCAIWDKVVASIISNDTADVDLAALVTSLAWAVSRSLGGNTPLKGDEHRKFISLYKASQGMSKPDKEGQEDPFQGLGVKCVGVLGHLAREPRPLATNRDIGIFLITIVTSASEAPAADVVEALDQLFDIYGDETLACEGVFRKDKFLEHLEGAVPKIKAMVKSIDKRAQPELRLRAEEAATNLSRFITYKRKHQLS